MVCRKNESGKTEQDMINDAIRLYNRIEPWQFVHCWEILRHESKWNDKVLELNSPTRFHGKQQSPSPAVDRTAPLPSDTPTQSMHADSTPLERPEGRDSVKRRRSKASTESASSTVVVEMLKKMHEKFEKFQEQDEQDSKYKEKLINIERARFEMQQKQWQAKYELSHKQIKVQRKTSLEQTMLQRDVMETIRV